MIEEFHDHFISYLFGESGGPRRWHQSSIEYIQNYYRTREVSAAYLCVNQTLLQDRDMLDILNARRTVLLKPLFQGLPEVPDVVALAILAMDLFHGNVPNASELGAWFIPLIKDDILTLLLSATDKSRLRQSQSHYISDLKSEATRWRLHTAQVEASRYVAMADAPRNCLRSGLETGQNACCTTLSVYQYKAVQLVGRLNKDPSGDLRQHREYSGGAPQELHENSPDTVGGKLLYPWLARRENGRWFLSPLGWTL